MSKKLVTLFLVFLAFAGGIYFHTNTLKVTRHQTTLGNGNQKLKIAHISDLHSSGFGRLEEQVYNALTLEKPDVIVITGDLATPSGTLDGYKEVIKDFKAPKGVYFVQGNWEFWEPISDLKYLLKETGVTDLTNRVHQLDHNLWLVGFDDSEEGTPQLEILKSLPPKAMKIGLFHSPRFFEKTAGLIELNLAGHSHGGQIRIPLMSPLWVPSGTGNYDQGWFEKENSRLFVSRGIGTSILPIRINCSPELAIIEVRY